MRYHTMVKGGRLIDPANDVDAIADIAFNDGKVAATGDLSDETADHQIDATGCLVMPGMIDFHAHVYWGGASLGIDADQLAKRAGTTTWVDVGTAGAGNFEGFKKHVIEPGQTRILAYLHISFAGIYGFSRDVMVGESTNLELLNPAACAKVAKSEPDLIRGIKVRIGAKTSGAHGLIPLQLAIEAAEEADLPVMCHIDYPPPSYSQVAGLLRKGDTLTHAFRPFPNAPVDGKGRVREAVLAARERGVLFDIAHGKGSFAFATAEKMLEHGFLPDIISSDVHTLCIDGPAYDNLETMSKFLALGMPINQIIRATTEVPANALGRPDLGDFSVGTTGDATILRIIDGDFTLEDVTGATRQTSRKFKLERMVFDGRPWPN